MNEADLFGNRKSVWHSSVLGRRFIYPPFSVLSARDGDWIERKRQWLAMGLRSDLGRSAKGVARGGNICSSAAAMQYSGSFGERFKAQNGGGIDGGLTFGGFREWAKGSSGGTSIFDPVLCEIVLSWFCPPGGMVLDPFAGGAVRGVVAGVMGRHYYGIDVRGEQIEANRQQAHLVGASGVMPEWATGDSRELVPAWNGAADFVFSCPPYGDLEVYSDLEADISNMEWGDFLAALRAIVASSVAKLRPNRFACFVVGDFRDKRGFYRNLIGETVRAFGDVGAGFYNEAILVQPLGTAPVRINAQWRKSRKLGKTHQNVLVFCKGDPVAAAQSCGGDAASDFAGPQ